MTWQDEADKHVNTPVIFIEIDFSSGVRRYSAEYVRTGTYLYKGNVLSFPNISSSVGDIKRTYERSQITIIFNDSDYEFRGLVDSESPGFKNRGVVVKIAFQDDAYASAMTIYTGRIFDWAFLDNLQFGLIVTENSIRLEQTYPDKLVDLADYADAHDSAIGQVIPIPYGEISANGLSSDGAFGWPSLSGSTGLAFIDTTQDAEQHLVGRQSAGITVDRVYKNDILQTEGGGNDYQISSQVIDGQTNTEIHWESGARPTHEDKISCDVSFGTRRPVSGIRHCLLNFCGYEVGDFNATSLADAQAVETTRSYDFAGALYEQKTLQTILDEWRDEFELDIYWNKAGEVCWNYLAPAMGTPNEYNDLLHILESFLLNPKVEEIMNYLDYGYLFHYAKTYYYTFGLKEDTDSQTKHGDIYKDFKGFKWVRTSATAVDLAARKVIRLKDPITFAPVAFPLRTFSDDLTDTLLITHVFGTGSAGFDKRLFQIRQTSYNINAFINSAILEDASNFSGRACFLGDEDEIAFTWTAASDADRNYFYLCSRVSGEFTNTDEGKKLLN